MATSAPNPFSNRRDTQNDSQQDAADRVIEHLRNPQEAEASQDLDDGGDAGTKGTGSAG